MYYLCSESKSVDQLCSDLICTYAKDRISFGVARMSHVTKKNVSLGFQARSDTKWTVQLQKMARGCTFRIKEEEELYYICSENIGADQLRS